MTTVKPPSTPPPLPAKLHSTPLSQGSSSHSSFETEHTREDYEPYLRHDLSNAQRISLNDFLRQVCGFSDAWSTRRQTIWHNLAKSLPITMKLSTFNNTTGLKPNLYPPFVALANALLDGLGHTKFRFCRNDNKIISGSHASRKPDIVVVRDTALTRNRTVESCNPLGPTPAFWWHDILSFNEVEVTEAGSRKKTQASGDVLSVPAPPTSRKRSSSNTQSGSSSKRQKVSVTSKFTQCASYALEMLAHAGFRDSVLGMYTKDGKIQLIHYDHSAVIVSEFVSISKDFETFICILDVLADVNWGISNLIAPATVSVPLPSDQRSPHCDFFSGAPLQFPFSNGELRLILGTILFYQHGIIGRGSFVIEATISVAPPQLAGKEGSVCVVKLSRPAKKRLSEPTLIVKARQLASRQDWQWVLQHLPEILYSTELPSTPTQLRLVAFFKDAYEQRVVRVVVMAQLFPMSALTDPADLGTVFKDVFKCYRWLCEHAKLLHRDISVANIMFRRGSNGQVHGVLNDFDHAIRIGPESTPSSRQRTGTAPYMAIDILDASPPPIHLYRHDLESLYYVLVCTVCPSEDPSIKKWFNSGGSVMADLKRAFFTKPHLTPQPGFQVFSKWMDALHTAFGDGLVARYNHSKGRLTDPPYDNETLGGNVTFDAFSVIFETDLV
ncbi:hypothetical protein BDP27DRAFT_1295858 [Rhodocollybia butyracea]|uniref:Protein kinase domain-containing protein n=1 Tax=Rhodocollybia butyracea TaxID=206335 RepID=A0A9P5U5J2_9AGAR|nr:hypothetical protein BDP27DRAFT_1295858 [Rhodocollybia butyracea]